MNNRIKQSVNYHEDIDLYKKKFKIALKNLGGKIKGDRIFKVLQIEKPSDGPIPEKYYDENMKLDALRNIGSMVELESMITISDCACIVDATKNYLSFLSDELCGKCVTCREGTRMMHYIVESITKGRGIEKDIDILIDLCETVKESSPCVLGKIAHNPILTSIEYFKDEYMEHIIEKKCSTGVCEELTSFLIQVN